MGKSIKKVKQCLQMDVYKMKHQFIVLSNQLYQDLWPSNFKYFASW